MLMGEKQAMRLSLVPAMAVMVLGGCALAQATAQVGYPPFARPQQQTPVEHLDWNGDPSAPNISGVWMRADDQGKTVAGDPEGWQPWAPPLKGKFLATWQRRVADTAAGKRTDDPVMTCQPPGMPRFITGDRSPLLIIQSHERVTMQRSGEGARRIWLDGRAIPAQKDLESFYKGTAVGRYDGHDLLVDSEGFKDEPIDATGMPHGDRMHISERYHRVDAQTLRVEVTVKDPDALARPIATTIVYKAVTDPAWEPKEFICTPKTDYHLDRYVH